jgi:hypothetical protein
MIYLNIMNTEDLPEDGIMPTPNNQTLSDFYVRLGMAIAAWQFIESGLVTLYTHALGLNYKQEIQASFHVPASFRTRLDMVKAAILHSDLPDEGKQEWNKLSNKISEKSIRRNKLAHSLVFHDFKRKPDDSLFMSANPLDPTRSKGNYQQGDIISKSDLEAMIGVFSSLSEAMTNYDHKWLLPRTQALLVPSDKRPDALTNVPVDHFREASRWQPES